MTDWNEIEAELLRRIQTPQDKVLCDIYKRASFGHDDWYEHIRNHDFMPAWPVLRHAQTKQQQLMPCFVLGIEDDLDSIMTTLARCARIFKLGGSTGINFSPLRPKGEPLSLGGTAAGPIAFMHLFDAAARTIVQSGTRRGGYMIVMDQDHGDIMEFIACKDQEGVLANMNISVRLKDISDEVFITIVAEHIWRSGEPGVLYAEHIAPYTCVNLCGEVPLPPWGVCNLGSINLVNCLRNNDLDWDRIETFTTELAALLDHCTDVNDYPFPEMKDEQLRSRRLGVGVMGWHELLSRLGLRYTSEEARYLASEIAKYMMKLLCSQYPSSAQHMSIAPTGQISLLCHTTPGIEPVYSRSFEIYSPQGNLTVSFDIDEFAPDIHWRDHILMQAAWQEYVDGAISKTILLGTQTTPQDVAQAITLGYELKLKGLTLYRIGSREHEAEVSVVTQGRTLRTVTNVGKLFTTLNYRSHKPFETFITIGRAGSLTQSFTEAIGRLISLALQHRVPLEAIIDQLQGIQSPPASRDPVLGSVSSVPDAIAKALQYLSGLEVPATETVGECPQCHGRTVRSEGCERCLSCGWTRCGV